MVGGGFNFTIKQSRCLWEIETELDLG